MGSHKRDYKWGVTIIITHIRGLITPLITTHEPPSSFRKEHRKARNGDLLYFAHYTIPRLY